MTNMFTNDNRGKLPILLYAIAVAVGIGLGVFTEGWHVFVGASSVTTYFYFALGVESLVPLLYIPLFLAAMAGCSVYAWIRNKPIPFLCCVATDLLAALLFIVYKIIVGNDTSLLLFILGWLFCTFCFAVMLWYYGYIGRKGKGARISPNRCVL